MGMPPPRPFIAAVLLLGVVGTSPARAQQPAALSQADLERIRRQFVEQPTESKFLGPVRVDYTVRVEEEPDDLDYRFGWLYDKSTITPGYVRPWYPIYHYDALMMTIPVEHRAQLYPAAITASSLFGGMKDAARKRQERKAKAQVEAEVRALQKK